MDQLEQKKQATENFEHDPKIKSWLDQIPRIPQDQNAKYQTILSLALGRLDRLTWEVSRFVSAYISEIEKGEVDNDPSG